MRRLGCLAAVTALTLLSACAGRHYPLSRAQAGPDDPVREIMLPILPWF